MQQCISHPSCYIPDKDDEYCFCPELYANNTVYCEEPPPPPGKITLSPIPATLGSDIVLEFTASDDVTNIRWFLGNVRLKMVMEVHNGSRTTVVTSSRTSTLTIKNIPRYWGGLYMCRYEYQGSHLETSHQVQFPLTSMDIVPIPPKVFIWKNSTNFTGITLECCIQEDGSSYNVFWEPGRKISGQRRQESDGDE
ncbi:hypothetical protein GDO81_026143 [Engystomops pustulosus]|uniref:Ig-like domain-containing protein n=1 Tax=Engystomops pustulosus TaxID=76066 RepID=A0AAV6YRB4_ENGPU|nr:hypothetical protein GDO81_026143 [Engystomops pustulosus]